MAKITIKPELREFLEKEGLLESFIENVKEDCVKREIEERRITNIMGAFTWGNTGQGVDYWSGVFRKYGEDIDSLTE